MEQSSFASILEGVKRMREEYDVEGEKRDRENSTQQEPQPENQREAQKQQQQEKRQEEHPPQQQGDTPNDHTQLTPPTASSNDSISTAVQNSTAQPPNLSNHSNTNHRHRARPAPQSYTAVQVSNSQKGNPLLTCSLMKSTPWSYNGSLLSDYYINASVQILFLLLKYHKVHPEYIWQRLKKLHRGSTVSLRQDSSLRVLLVVVDIDSYQELLRKLADLCIKQDLSLVLAWSFEEAGNYIAYAKQYETLAANTTSAIRGVKSQDYRAAVVDTLTSIPAVNKTDVVNLLANFHSFYNVVTEGSRGTRMGEVLGMGARKVENMKRVFTEPFVYNRD